MKKLRFSILALAAVAFVAVYACNSNVKKEVKEEVQEVIEEPAAQEEVVADSTVVADTVAMETEEVVEESAE